MRRKKRNTNKGIVVDPIPNSPNYFKSQELWQMVRKGELKCQGICSHNQTFNHCNPKRRGTKFGHSGAERAKYSQTCIKQLIPQGMVW